MDRGQERNLHHLRYPKPGDYWHEMLCGICVVLDVREEFVTICRTKKQYANDTWSWNLAPKYRETMTLYEFEKWLTYNTNRDATWAYVEPEAHKWVLKIIEERDWEVLVLG